jgi:hypothetical protein
MEIHATRSHKHPGLADVKAVAGKRERLRLWNFSIDVHKRPGRSWAYPKNCPAHSILRHLD